MKAHIITTTIQAIIVFVFMLPILTHADKEAEIIGRTIIQNPQGR